MLADREIELTLLDDLVRSAGNGGGSLVVVSGPIGVGKTALLGAVAARAADGTAVLGATGSTLERLFPFGVVRQLCEPVLAELDDDARATVDAGLTEFAKPLFSNENCLSVPVDARDPVMQQVMHGVRHVLAVHGAARPVLLLVDDLQWADAESLRCLGYLANRLAGTGVSMVVTVREGSPDGDNQGVRGLLSCASRLLRLGPLSATGVRAIVRQRFGRPGSDRFVQACGEVSRGNPMVLGAVLDELVSAAGTPEDGAVDWVHACRPALLRDRMAARLRAQPDPAMALLRALSCLGQAADQDTLSRLAGLDPIGYAEIVRSVTAQGFLLPTPAPVFAHPVVREAVDRLTSPAQAERLHVGAASLLHAAGRPAEEVAAHLLAVPSPQAMWAVDVLREAAGAAARRGEVDEAARHLRRALLDTAPESVDRADLLLELAAVERVVDAPAATRHVLEAVSLSVGAAGQAAAFARLAPASFALSPPPVLSALRGAVEQLGQPGELSGLERELALRLEARTMVGAYCGAPQIEAAVRRLRDGDQDRLLETQGGRELLAVSLELAAVAGAVPANEVARLCRQVMDREPATAGQQGSAPLLVCALSLADSAEQAGPWLDDAIDSAVRQRDRVAHAVVEACRTLAMAGTGRGEELSAAASALAAGDGWFDAVSVAGMLRVLTSVELTTGPGACAVHPLAARTIELCGHRTDHPAVSAMLRLVAASRAMGDDDHRHAVELLLDAGRQLDRAGWRNPALVPWRSCAASALHRFGDTAEALELAEAEYELAVAWGSPAAIGHALGVRGALTPGAAGVGLLRTAVDVTQDSENELTRATAHLLLGGRLQAGGSAEADQHLRRGRDLTDRNTARRVAENLASGLGGLAGVVEPGRPLTVAEGRVVSMVVEGLTNQAIADELGVSRRAVEKHLTNVYAKYDVAGRTELKSTLVTGARPQRAIV